MDRIVVGELLAARSGFKTAMETAVREGAPCVMANGEPGVVHYSKRPGRKDRRRRRNGHRFTPKPVEWKG
jgi:hypothetical protein